MNAATLHRATLLAAGLCLSASGQTAEYFALPNNFQPNNISGDGTTVVGMVGRNDGPAVWTVADGLTVLRGPGGASIRGGAWAASADGSVVVGTVLYNGHQVPFRWTAAEGMNVLAPQGLTSAGNGYGVSADGEIACGQGGMSGPTGFLWDSVHGLRDLTHPPDDASGSVASAVSGDGRYAVGWQARRGGDVFLRWDTQTLAVEALTLRDGSGQALLGQVLDTNQDGQVVVGRAAGPVGGTRPVIWTSNGLEFIGPANGYARRTTADGVVVCGSDQPVGGTAWLWTPGLGTTNFVDFLRDDHGLTVPGASYGQIYGVSDDGRAFCGSGSPSSWYVRLAAARPADFNRDEMVDFLDLMDFTDCFEGRHLLPVSSADLNHDGITDFFDYIQFIDDFGG